MEQKAPALLGILPLVVSERMLISRSAEARGFPSPMKKAQAYAENGTDGVTV